MMVRNYVAATPFERLEKFVRKQNLSIEHLAFILACSDEHAQDILLQVVELSPEDKLRISLFRGCAGTTRRDILARVGKLRGDDGELWATIDGASKYQVSNRGRVRKIFGHPAKRRATLRLRLSQDGYFRCTVYDDAKAQRAVFIHRLVCRTFNGDPPAAGMHACHRDGVRTNNFAENLYWGTANDNAQDAKRHRAERARLMIQKETGVNGGKTAISRAVRIVAERENIRNIKWLRSLVGQ